MIRDNCLRLKMPPNTWQLINIITKENISSLGLLTAKNPLESTESALSKTMRQNPNFLVPGCQISPQDPCKIPVVVEPEKSLTKFLYALIRKKR